MERNTAGSSLFWRLDEVRKLNKIVGEITPSIHLPSFFLKGTEASAIITRELRMKVQEGGGSSVGKSLLCKHKNSHEDP